MKQHFKTEDKGMKWNFKTEYIGVKWHFETEDKGIKWPPKQKIKTEGKEMNTHIKQRFCNNF